MDKIILIDLDGTLFYPQRKKKLISKDNEAFLKKIHADGWRICFCTSRTLSMHKTLEEKLGFKVDYIGANGAFVFADMKPIFKKGFEPTSIRDCLKEIDGDLGSHLVMLSSGKYPNILRKSNTPGIFKFLFKVHQAFAGVYALDTVFDDDLFYSEIDQGWGLKLMFFVGLTKKLKKKAERLTGELNEKYPDLEFAWINQFIEITPKGCSKASGARLYLDYLGANVDNMLVVGDSGNDVPLFDEFHVNSYCMEHAPESVRKRAAHTIKYVSDLDKVLYPLEDSSTPKKEEK